MGRVDEYVLDEGVRCSVAVDWGCNVFDWRENEQQIFFCPPDYPEAAWKITGGGNPLLFPAVGRTWNHSSGEPVAGQYRIHGIDKEFNIPTHGILFLCTWDKIGENRTGDSVSAEYELVVPEKVREENYPFDVGLRTKITLGYGTLEVVTTLHSRDSRPAPAAFGYHPYFRISSKERRGVSVDMPVRRHLLLTKDTVLFTGETEPTNGHFDLQPGIYYDNAYDQATGTTMILTDRRINQRIRVDFDEKLELFFLFSPDDSEFVCIEPWTRGLGAFENLKDPGWETGELIPVLQPGETRSYRVLYTVDPS